MSPLAVRKIRFAHAVFALDVTPKTLRNWLQREQVTLFEDQPEGWKTYSHLDIAKLALVRRMVDFGLGVEDANDIAESVLREKWGQDRILRTYKNPPPDVIAATFNVDLLIVSKIGGEYRPEIRFTTAVSDDPLPDTYLTIHIAEAIRTAFARLDEFGEDD